MVTAAAGIGGMNRGIPLAPAWVALEGQHLERGGSSGFQEGVSSSKEEHADSSFSWDRDW